MKRDEQAPVLTAIFVDYDNIYMSLKRKSDEAAKRFAKLSRQLAELREMFTLAAVIPTHHHRRQQRLFYAFEQY